MTRLGQNARQASRAMAAASTAAKNAALEAIAEQITLQQDSLMASNELDLKNGASKGLDSALLDRLALTPARIETMIEGLHQVSSLPDPIGAITDLSYRPSGIQVGKMRVPLGVIGIVYESRPNVTVEAASLCIKSGNAVILRGGSEAKESNLAIARCVSAGVAAAGLPEAAVQVVETVDRAAVGELITMSEFVDVVVPRGGKGLIERISRDATVMVIKHLDGNCHTYIHDLANRDMAVSLAVNAKTQRYGTCNTTETLLLASSVANELLPMLLAAFAEHKLELRLCEQTSTLVEKLTVPDGLQIKVASEIDWSEEFLAPVLAVKLVDSLDDAIEHINLYSSQHTESIVTEDYSAAMKFLREVDSSSVMVNASTRFADGFEYGLGAEIGISTDKIHARGPVGLEGLTSQKYVVFGSGQVRN